MSGWSEVGHRESPRQLPVAVSWHVLLGKQKYWLVLTALRRRVCRRRTIRLYCAAHCLKQNHSKGHFV